MVQFLSVIFLGLMTAGNTLGMTLGQNVFLPQGGEGAVPSGPTSECDQFTGTWKGKCTRDGKPETRDTQIRQVACQLFLINGEPWGVGGVVTKTYANRGFNSTSISRFDLVDGKVFVYETEFFTRSHQSEGPRDGRARMQGRAWLEGDHLRSEEVDSRKGHQSCIYDRVAP